MKRKKRCLKKRILYMYKTFNTNRLSIIKYNIDFVNDVFEIYNKYEVMKWAGPKRHLKKIETIKFIEESIKQTNNETTYFWAIKFDRKIIGDISICPNYRHKYASVGTFLNYNYWNKGIMFEAMQPIIWFSFNILKLNRLEAQIYFKHNASIKLFEKLGFTKEATLRQNFLINNTLKDSIMYSLLKKESIILNNFDIIT